MVAGPLLRKSAIWADHISVQAGIEAKVGMELATSARVVPLWRRLAKRRD